VNTVDFLPRRIPTPFGIGMARKNIGSCFDRAKVELRVYPKQIPVNIVVIREPLGKEFIGVLFFQFLSLL
jgi:hypothetical protein